MAPKKKLEFKTFSDLKREYQIKVALYFIGAALLIMVGVSGLSGLSNGMNIGAILMILGGLGGGAWLGYSGYNILVDPKNEKVCNASYWNVTNQVGFDKENLKSDIGISLCKAQIKAEYEGYAGFYCEPNEDDDTTVDVYYINMPDSKKLALKSSGTSNVFTVKAGDNKITVTDPPGMFTISFASDPAPSRNVVKIVGKDFLRIDETKNISVSWDTTSPVSMSASSSYTVQNLKDGIQLNGPFQDGTRFTVVAYSTKTEAAVSRTLKLSTPAPGGGGGSPSGTSPRSPGSPRSP